VHSEQGPPLAWAQALRSIRVDVQDDRAPGSPWRTIRPAAWDWADSLCCRHLPCPTRRLIKSAAPSRGALARAFGPPVQARIGITITRLELRDTLLMPVRAQR
jgi:hypothetical protein